MKTSKIPGLGDYGRFIDDVSLVEMSDNDWIELGKEHLTDLVTIIRNVDIHPNEFERKMLLWGDPFILDGYRIRKKYKKKLGIRNFYSLFKRNLIEDEDRKHAEDLAWMGAGGDEFIGEKIPWKSQLHRISGIKENGKAIGMFAEGELLWHSNEPGSIVFNPGIALMGVKGMVGTSTGFATTASWYEKQKDSFKRELDEMTVKFIFKEGYGAPGLNKDHDDIFSWNQAFDPIELPLVITSPGGIKGLHYSPYAVEETKFFKEIDNELFAEENIYHHKYQQNNDICIFDNSITLHNRIGSVEERVAYRTPCDYCHLIPEGYNYYSQEPYKTQFTETRKDIQNTLNLQSRVEDNMVYEKFIKPMIPEREWKNNDLVRK
jgi:alpha-ketoglutarate-dependent taurine dioxygenase